LVSGVGVIPVVGRTGIIGLMAGEVDLTVDAGLTNEAPVSVELLDFTGRWMEDRLLTELQWQTSLEINSDYFGIERTENVSEGFEEIGREKAAGNSSEETAYLFEDTEIYKSGIYYYRLRQVDLDGSFEYSKIIAVEVIFDDVEEQKISMGVYPNPAAHDINVDLVVKRPASFEGGFYDAIGQLIKKVDKQQIPAGKTTINVDINDLPVGTYLLRVKVDDQVIFEKIAKTN
ncbi:MAG: T9SS type A sorting domain-containing protein, partial [Saprospiraceae bacterium]|nr:T9SS type A sorting domain-containing protein [Bacteroidia bacterium]NNK89229.1 T9SS type A sorting domain-containing protein [Saprospiraceae bacterium]